MVATPEIKFFCGNATTISIGLYEVQAVDLSLGKLVAQLGFVKSHNGYLSVLSFRTDERLIPLGSLF
jgi:hypothetical protein